MTLDKLLYLLIQRLGNLIRRITKVAVFSVPDKVLLKHPILCSWCGKVEPDILNLKTFNF